MKKNESGKKGVKQVYKRQGRRWHGRMWILHLPTTSEPFGRWWGTLIPKEMGGTSERPSRMCGEVRG